MSASSKKWEGSSESVEYKPARGAIVLLLAVITFVFVGVAFLLWYVPTVGLGNIHPVLPYVLGFIFGSAALFVLGGVVIILASMATGKGGGSRWLLLKFFLPLVMMAGSIVGISKTRIERSFIEMNNQMVLAMKRRLRPERLLILMPHCIQYEDCKIKVTKDVTNCVSCGKCEIADLLTIMDEFGVNLFVSTGGTVARQKLVEYRPDVVLAVACERDLASGLTDAYPLPVYAIINKRPKGYCNETGVAIEDVKGALTAILAH